MSLRLDLLRHGQTELGGGLRGSLDDALTPEGWAQMRAAVADESPWTAIVSSPLQRCARFADELAARLGLPVQLEPDLRELHFGDWEGRSAAALMETDADGLGRFWADPYGFTPPGGEPLHDFALRVRGAVARLVEQYSAGHVLVVTHGGVMRLLLAEVRGLPESDLMQVVVAHGELARLQFDGRWQERR